MIDNIALKILTDDNAKNFTIAMANMAEFTKKLGAESNDLKGFFKEIKQSFAELKSGSTELTATMKHFRGLIDDNKAGISDFTSTGLKETTSAMTQLRELSSSLSRVTQKAERGPLRYITQQDDNTEDLG